MEGVQGRRFDDGVPVRADIAESMIVRHDQDHVRLPPGFPRAAGQAEARKKGQRSRGGRRRAGVLQKLAAGPNTSSVHEDSPDLTISAIYFWPLGDVNADEKCEN
jgi:hypothetical protein